MNKGKVIFWFVAISLIATLVYFLNKRNNKSNLMSKSKPKKDNAQANIQAFLKMIQYAEGTSLRANPYAVCYGYSHTVTNFSDHPANTGEWKGKTLPNSMCAGAGLSNGCISSAAGAYQFIKPTWNSLKSKLNLPDFSPESQDLAALELIRQKGALKDVEAGRFSEAIGKIKKIWASMPSAGYNQPERSFMDLASIYTNNGGQIS